jgi:hypothetical protein
MFEEISRADTPEARQQPNTISVYRKGNELVIRQLHRMSNEEPYIVLPIEGAEGLIEAIQREIKSG